MKHTMVTQSRQQGVGMVEILVTLFVLSVGLLGVAALQFVGAFSNVEAVNRTHGELVAKQVTERLRAAARTSNVGDGMVVNNTYFNAQIYNFSGMDCPTGNPYVCHCLTLPADVPNCQTGDCTAAQMAAYDGWALSCSAVQTNPKTLIDVSCDDNVEGDVDDCSVGSRISIQVKWPVSVSENRNYELLARCNEGDSDRFGCVYKDVTL